MTVVDVPLSIALAEIIADVAQDIERALRLGTAHVRNFAYTVVDIVLSAGKLFDHSGDTILRTG